MSAFGRIIDGLFSAKVTLVTPEATIEYYRKMGFFAGQNTESVIARFREEWGIEPPVGTPWDDVFLLRFDEKATWVGDPEADVCAENNVYAQVLPEWGKITQGAFVPLEIEETWESDTGPIEVTFLLDGHRVVLGPSYQDDWIDLEILTSINRILEPTGKRFNAAIDGNFCLLTFLDTKTERRMRSERKFPFVLR